MASGYSYNGWPANDDPNAINIQKFGDKYGLPFPGGVKGGDVAAVLGYVASQFHYRVEEVISGWDWGYSYRANVNNPSSLSCHASGTALDINAPLHGNGSVASDSFTNAQITEIYRILDEVQGAVNWLDSNDPMHFEIAVNSSDLARVAATLPTGSTPEMPLSKDDLEQIRAVVDERIQTHLGAGAVNDPAAALNAGLSQRITLDRQRDLAAWKPQG